MRAFRKIGFKGDGGENLGRAGIQEHDGRRRVMRVGRVQGIVHELQDFMVLGVGIFKNKDGFASQGVEGVQRRAPRAAFRNVSLAILNNL